MTWSRQAELRSCSKPDLVSSFRKTLVKPTWNLSDSFGCAIRKFSRIAKAASLGLPSYYPASPFKQPRYLLMKSLKTILTEYPALRILMASSIPAHLSY